MNHFLSDRVIDDQGNVKTVAGGQDAKLYYIDFQGNRKKYLIEGDQIGGQQKQTVQYKENFQLLDNTTTVVEQPITNINYQIPTATNALCIFTTGDQINYTFSYSTQMKVNKQFEFEPNMTYAVAVDNGLIIWSKFQEIVSE